jgi:hypothetical protein
LLYHGSVHKVVSPDTSRANTHNDFGRGFYTTANKEEAIDWAKKKSAYQERPGYLNIYELTHDKGLTYHEFDRYSLIDLFWLDYILLNRGYSDFVSLGRDFSVLNKDILIGPIANNKLAIQMNMLTSGLIEGDSLQEIKTKFIGLLLPSRLDDQICFKNDFATSHLSYLGVEYVV